jgi:hypothetical protein
LAYSIEYVGGNVNCIPQRRWMMEGPNGKILKVGLSRKEWKLIGGQRMTIFTGV